MGVQDGRDNLPSRGLPVGFIRGLRPTEANCHGEPIELNGELITELENSFKYAGSYKIRWDAENLASGMYFIQYTSGNFVATQKLLLLK